MRTNKTLSFIVMVLLLFSLAVMPVIAGGKQEKKEQPTQEQSSSQSSSEQQEQETEQQTEQDQDSEGTPIPSGNVSTEGEVAAVVNGQEIPMSRLEQQVRTYQQQMMQQGQQLQGMQLSQLRRQALESLINTEVLYQIAKDKGYKAPEDKVNSELDSMKQRFGGQQQFQAMLQQQGLTENDLRDNVAQVYVIQQFIDEQFAPEVNVSDQDAKDFYDQNTASFKQQEQVRASHILIEVKEDASEEQKDEARSSLQEVQKKLDDGAEFSELAREYSQGPSAKNGGDLGYFGRGQMVKSFEEKAFSMEKGEVSDIVETRFGYHIIKVTDKKEEKTVPYAEVKERIVNYLKEKQRNENILAFLEEKKQEMEIERTALEKTEQ